MTHHKSELASSNPVTPNSETQGSAKLGSPTEFTGSPLIKGYYEMDAEQRLAFDAGFFFAAARLAEVEEALRELYEWSKDYDAYTEPQNKAAKVLAALRDSGSPVEPTQGGEG